MISEVHTWQCPACGYTTFTHSKKNEHLAKTQNDPIHVVINEQQGRYDNTMLMPTQSTDVRYTELEMNVKKDERLLN